MSLGLKRGTRACHNSRMQLSIVCSRVAMSSPLDREGAGEEKSIEVPPLTYKEGVRAKRLK